MEQLTDEQCDKLRRLPGSFNDMLRAVHYGGYMRGAQEAVEAVEKERGTVSQFATASDCTKHNMAINAAINAIEEHFDFQHGEGN